MPDRIIHKMRKYILITNLRLDKESMRPEIKVTILPLIFWRAAGERVRCPFSPSGSILGPCHRPGGGLHPHVVGLYLPRAPLPWGGWQAGGAEIRPLLILFYHPVIHHRADRHRNQSGYRKTQTRAGEATFSFQRNVLFFKPADAVVTEPAICILATRRCCIFQTGTFKASCTRLQLTTLPVFLSR